MKRHQYSLLNMITVAGVLLSCFLTIGVVFGLMPDYPSNIAPFPEELIQVAVQLNTLEETTVQLEAFEAKDMDEFIEKSSTFTHLAYFIEHGGSGERNTVILYGHRANAPKLSVRLSGFQVPDLNSLDELWVSPEGTVVFAIYDRDPILVSFLLLAAGLLIGYFTRLIAGQIIFWIGGGRGFAGEVLWTWKVPTTN